jgi:hypothetical protein
MKQDHHAEAETALSKKFILFPEQSVAPGSAGIEKTSSPAFSVLRNPQAYRIVVNSAETVKKQKGYDKKQQTGGKIYYFCQRNGFCGGACHKETVDSDKGRKKPGLPPQHGENIKNEQYESCNGRGVTSAMNYN